MKRFRILLTAVLAGVLMGLSIPGYTDDTSLYNRPVDVLDENSRPNILFVLDRSWSMRKKDPGNTGTRMERMQEALLRLMDDMNNVNVGFMTFSGQPPKDRTGARVVPSTITGIDDKSVVPVRFPITYIDEPARNVLGEQYIQGESRILLSADDAEEDMENHNVVLDDAELEAVYRMGTDMTPGKILISQIGQNADDAVEFTGNGSEPRNKVYSYADDNVEDDKFKNILLGSSKKQKTIVGLRFSEVKLPQNAKILKANILFTAQADTQADTIDDLKLFIYSVNKKDAGSFENSSKYISNNNNYPKKSNARKNWEPGIWIKEEVYSTPDIGDLVQKIVDLSNGENEGYTIAFKIEYDNDSGELLDNQSDDSGELLDNKSRSFYTIDASASKAPKLRIVYEEEGGIAGAAGDETTVTQQISQTNNDATEYRGGGEEVIGSVTSSTDSLWLGNRECGEECIDETLVGLRFTNLEIPKGAIIVRTVVEFTANQNGLNDLDLIIHAQDSFDSNTALEFDGANGNLSSRSMSESVPWNVPEVSNNEKLVSADFSSLVQAMVEDDNWVSADNALVLLFARANDSQNGSRSVYDSTGNAANAPILHIDWVKKREPVNQKVGLRFKTVQIPRGAIVESARIDFTSGADASGKFSLKIHGEAHDDSPEFESELKNISNRTPTSSVNWNNRTKWRSGLVYSTPDLKDIVQNIVQREGWCGGNAMSFIISEGGTKSLRNIKSFDDSPKNVPVLHVEYDLDTVPEDTCINEIYSKQISHGNDDAEEMIEHQGGSSNKVYLTSNTLEMTTTFDNDNKKSNRLIGLRFSQIPIERKTTILNAELVFTAIKSDDNDTTLEIIGEKSPNAEEFNDEDSNLSNLDSRPKTTAKKEWKPDAWTVGQKYTSVNIAEIVKEIVDQPEWRSFNDMAFFIRGSGLRQAVAYDYDPSQAVILRITMEGGKGLMTTRQRIKEMINGITLSDYTPLVDAIYEAGQYYRGEEVTHGKDRVQKRQKSNGDTINNNARMRDNRVSHPGSWDQETGELYRKKGCTNANLSSNNCITEEIKPKGSNKPKYIKPQSALCQSNFIVFLTDGAATTNSSAGLVKTLLGKSECDDKLNDSSTFYYTEKEKCGVDMVRYLYDEDLDTNMKGKQNVITYTIGFNLKDNQDAVQYMTDWADAGHGGFYEASSANELHTVLTKIFGNVVVKSSSFAAPSLSINVFNQLYHDNEIYISLFKPGHETSWSGNIKKYNLCADQSCEVGQIMDANDNPAINAEDNKISEDALGFWTKTITPSEPDGNEVDKGGAGAVLLEQDPTSRHIYTNVTNGNELTEVDTQNNDLKASYFGSSTTSADRKKLINWIRGYRDGDPAVGERNWLLLDSLHTSPGAITTGKQNNKTITKIFAATNGGEIRALDAETGKEDWVFIPKEMLSIQNTLMKNEGNFNHTYGIDGEFAFIIKENNGIASSIKLFIGMRRGGRNIYALNVTPDDDGNYTSAYKPELMWTIRGGETQGFDRLGQTWSMPKPAKVRYNNNVKTVLLFGGGYEAETQDDLQSFSTVDQFSNAIYMVDPDDNGKRLWWVSNTSSQADLKLDGMDYSIPSNLTLIDNTGDGVINRIYVGDTGGNVWRIDLGPNLGTSSGDSVGRKLASLGVASSSGISNLRQFFYAPDVVMMNDPDFSSQAKYDVVLIKSGSRPNPLGTSTKDRFYALRDPDIGSLSKESVYEPLTHSDLFDATNDIIYKDSDPDDIDELKDSKGWYINLEGPGEKGLSSPFVLDGTVYFTTFVPPGAVTDDADADAVCMPQGGGMMYALDILNGGAALNYDEDNDLTTNDGDVKKVVTVVKDKDDRKRELGAGIPSSVQPIMSKSGISVIVGTGGGIDTQFVKTIGTNQIFWLQK